MAEKMIKTENLSAGYYGKAVVGDVELSLCKGEILTLVGPNGSGKSTLLKTVSAQLSPVSGTVFIGKDDIKALSGKDIARQMALVLTMHKKTDRMTCFDVVAMGRYPYTGRLGVLSGEDIKKIEEAMESVFALDLKDEDFNSVSDGQRQRVLLARAICQEPKIIILDEPTSFLDIKYKIELLSVLKKMAAEKGTAIIMSLHEIDLARKISDTVVCVKDGRIQKSGKAEDVLTKESICHLFDITEADYESFFEEKTDFVHYTTVSGKKLRCGYTTGSCAALAATAAARFLFSKKEPESVRLMTPKGIAIEVKAENFSLKDGVSSCSVKKFAGDDIDATAGCDIFASVTKTASGGIVIDGGEGVGRVTKAGLDQPVGEAAINSVPRQMIKAALEGICDLFGEEKNLKVIISVPEGEKIAKKTFNPNLGIVGGISIIGTTGIVEPMSVQAIIDTKKIELHQAAIKNGERLILTPGNYGVEFLKQNGITDDVPVVVCSNFIGEMLDAATAEGFKEVLLVGHIGKLVKIAGGIMNTHSRQADCRTELICAHTALCGGNRALCEKIMSSATTDAALELLKGESLWEEVLESLLFAIQKHLERRVDYKVGAVLFSNVYGLLGKTKGAEEIIEIWKGGA